MAHYAVAQSIPNHTTSCKLTTKQASRTESFCRARRWTLLGIRCCAVSAHKGELSYTGPKPQSANKTEENRVLLKAKAGRHPLMYELLEHRSTPLQCFGPPVSWKV